MHSTCRMVSKEGGRNSRMVCRELWGGLVIPSLVPRCSFPVFNCVGRKESLVHTVQQISLLWVGPFHKMVFHCFFITLEMTRSPKEEGSLLSPGTTSGVKQTCRASITHF
jgi:hypothetical protein